MRWLKLIIALSLFFFGTSAFATTDLNNAREALHHHDYSVALQYLRPLAENGDATAQFQLGMMFASGHGVPQDYQEAAHWLEKSAARGNARAENNLGGLFDQGRGVAQDSKAAAVWYRKAARQGNAAAQVNLASLYLEGRGVPADSIRAFAWASAAAQLGEPGAESILRNVAKHMTPAQISRAQRVASTYQNNYPTG